MILIGSRALKLRCPQAFDRKCSDFDFVCTQEEYDQWLEKNFSRINIIKQYSVLDGKKLIIEGDTNLEFELIKPGNSCELLQELVNQDPETINTSFGQVPNVDLLFTIKSSHKYLKNSPFFWKTVKDYHTMKHLGASIRPEYQEFHKVREDETYAVQKHPKLNQSKKDFFVETDNFYQWDHDDIHNAVKKFDQPAYRYYMKDNSEVMSCKVKFNNCSREIQLAGGVEEASTLAIERSLVPSPGVMTPKQAWLFALSKVCSSITSGFFRKYCYENIFEIINLYDPEYHNKFLKGVENGTVRKFNYDQKSAM